MPDEPNRPPVRASHTDRAITVERLGRALADGRITVEEFEERSAAAHRAVTRDELATLTADLPGRLW